MLTPTQLKQAQKLITSAMGKKGGKSKSKKKSEASRRNLEKARKVRRGR